MKTSELHLTGKALDVSNYQGKVDWRRVAEAGYHNAAIKATEGGGLRDRFFDPEAKRNAEHARAAGVRFSLYHYAHPSESPRREAHFFLDHILGEKLVRQHDPAPALDLEVTEGLDPRALWRWQHTFCEIVGDALDTTVVLYSYLSFLEFDIWLPPKHRPIWGAAYGSVPTQTLHGWHAWQFTSGGNVPGINGRVDLDSILKPLPTIGRKI